jgi:hypothetical protein
MTISIIVIRKAGYLRDGILAIMPCDGVELPAPGSNLRTNSLYMSPQASGPGTHHHDFALSPTDTNGTFCVEFPSRLVNVSCESLRIGTPSLEVVIPS